METAGAHGQGAVAQQLPGRHTRSVGQAAAHPASACQQPACPPRTCHDSSLLLRWMSPPTVRSLQKAVSATASRCSPVRRCTVFRRRWPTTSACSASRALMLSCGRDRCGCRVEVEIAPNRTKQVNRTEQVKTHAQRSNPCGGCDHPGGGRSPGPKTGGPAVFAVAVVQGRGRVGGVGCGRGRRKAAGRMTVAGRSAGRRQP